MPELKKTSVYETKKKSHYHIGYLKNEFEGETTVNDNHAHKLIYIPDQSPEFDPMNPSIQTQPAIIGGWKVQEADKHSHTLEEYTPVPKKEKEQTDEEIISDCLEVISEIDKIEEDSIAQGEESDEMYCNRQWNEELKFELESKDRAALTTNKMEQKHDILAGYQSQNRTEPKFYPVEGGDAIVADILQYVFKDITENCYYQREKSKAFSDTIITGRGLLEVVEDFTDDILGKIVIERFPWREAGFLSHNKEDLSDCEAAYKYKWFSKANLKAMYPDKVEDLVTSEKSKKTKKSYDKLDDKFITGNYWVSKNGKNIKVIELWRKIFDRNYILANSQDNFIFNAMGWKESDITSVSKLDGFVKLPRVTYKFRVNKLCENVLLEDYYEEEPYYNTVPVYAKKRGDMFWGKLETVKDLQVAINKAWSHFMDIMNKIAGYGWFYDDQTFANKMEENNFKKNSSSSGWTCKLNDTNKIPIKVEGVKFPTEIANAIELFNSELREIMNIDLSMSGFGNENSNVLLKQKIAQQLIGNDYIFDNLSFAEKQVCRIVIRKIQKLYTPERILRIVENQNMRNPKAPVELGGRRLMPQNGMIPQQGMMQGQEQEQEQSFISPDEILKLLQTTDLTKHDIIISESAESPSVMMSNFLMIMEVAGRGVPIPPDLMFELAPIPEVTKNKVREAMQMQMQQQKQMEDKKYDTEIQKVLLSNQAKMGGGQGGQMPMQG